MDMATKRWALESWLKYKMDTVEYVKLAHIIVDILTDEQVTKNIDAIGIEESE